MILRNTDKDVLKFNRSCYKSACNEVHPSQISTMRKEDHEVQKTNSFGKMQQELPEISQHRLKNKGRGKLYSKLNEIHKNRITKIYTKLQPSLFRFL